MNKQNITMPPSDDSQVAKFGIGVLIVVFVILGGWAAFAPLATSVVAIGSVSADLNKKTVQHLEGGIVGHIYVKDGDEVKKGDLLIKLDDVAIKAKIIQLNKQIDGYKSLQDSKRKRLDSIKQEIKEWNELYKQQLIDKQRIRELERESNQIEGDLANLDAEIAKLKEQIIVLEDTLSRTEIRAPIDGTVIGLGIHTVGAVIAPGSKILEIVPSKSKLIVIAKIQTKDIDKVHVGLIGDVRFSAFNLRQAPEIQGKVTYVSADTFIDKATHIPYYEAKIEVTKEGQKQMKKYHFDLVAGMPAEIMIRVGTRTALSYFLKPFRDMLTRGFNEE